MQIHSEQRNVQIRTSIHYQGCRKNASNFFQETFFETFKNHLFAMRRKWGRDPSNFFEVLVHHGFLLLNKFHPERLKKDFQLENLWAAAATVVKVRDAGSHRSHLSGRFLRIATTCDREDSKFVSNSHWQVCFNLVRAKIAKNKTFFFAKDFCAVVEWKARIDDGNQAELKYEASNS